MHSASQLEINLINADEKTENLSKQIFSLIQQKLAQGSSLRNVFFCKKSPTDYIKELAHLLDQMTEEELSEFTAEFKGFLNQTCTGKCSALNYTLSMLANIGAFLGGGALTAVGSVENNPYKLASGIVLIVLFPFITKLSVKLGAILDIKEDIETLLFFSRQLKQNQAIYYKSKQYKDSYSIYQQFNGQSLFAIEMALENETQFAQNTRQSHHTFRLS